MIGIELLSGHDGEAWLLNTQFQRGPALKQVGILLSPCGGVAQHMRLVDLIREHGKWVDAPVPAAV